MPIVSFLLFVVVSSFTPGPNNMMAMTFAHKYGARQTMPFCIGVGVGFAVIMGIVLVFQLWLTRLLPIVEIPLSLLGAGYMLYLAYKLLTSKADAAQAGQQQHVPAVRLFVIGIVWQFVNPKGVLYGMAAVSTFVLPYATSWAAYVCFALVLGLFGTMSTYTWSVLGGMLQTTLSRYRKRIYAVMAALLVYMAFTLVFPSVLRL